MLLLYLVYGLGKREFTNAIPFIVIAFFLVLVISQMFIEHYKNKKGILLKWLIIILFLLITLSFVGCAGVILSDSYKIAFV